MHPVVHKVRIAADTDGSYTYSRVTNWLTITARDRPGFVPAMSPAGNLSMEMGATRQLTTNLFSGMTLPNGTALASRSVEWTSSNPSVASVTGNGQGNGDVRALAPGTTVIRARSTCGSYNLTKTITVNSPPVTAVTNFRTTAQTSNSVTLAWNAVAYAQSYDIEFGGQVINTTGTSRTITGLSPLARYSFRIRAKHATSAGAYSSLLNISTRPVPLVAPANLGITSKSYDSISLSWDQVTHADRYEVTYGGTSMSVNIPAVSLSGLLPDTEYNISVRAINSLETGPVRSISVITDKKPPANPNNLVPAYVGHTEALISWDQVEGAVEYIAEFGGDIITVYENKIELSSLKPDTTYIFKVKSKDLYLESDWSLEFIFKTLPLSAPVGFVAAGKSLDSIRLEWQVISGALEYELLVNDGSVFTDKNYIDLDNLISGTEYRFKLRGIHSDVKSPWSEELSVKTDALVLLTPRVSLIQTTTTSISLSWPLVLEADYYLVNYGTGEVRVSESSAVITGLLPFTDYEVKVKAVNEHWAVESEYSSPLTVRTNPLLLDAVLNLIYTEKGYASVSLNWSAVPEATEYRVSYGTQIITTTDTFVTVSGLNPDSLYTFSVRGQNSYTYGPHSEITVITESPSIGTPANLISTGHNESSISLNWDEVLDASGYIVNYNGQSIVSRSNSITLGNLEADTEYSITIRSRNDYITGEPSAELKVTTDKLSHTAVTGLNVSARSSSSISLEWNLLPEANTYEVRFGNVSVFSQSSEITLEGLSPGREYEISVRGNSLENTGEWSAPLKATTLRNGSIISTEFFVNAQNTKTYEIEITGSDLYFDGSNIFVVTYDPSTLRLLDFASQAEGSYITAGAIPNTDIRIVSVSEGAIEFRVTKEIGEEQVWSGILTIARFQSLSTRRTSIYLEY